MFIGAPSMTRKKKQIIGCKMKHLLIQMSLLIVILYYSILAIVMLISAKKD